MTAQRAMQHTPFFKILMIMVIDNLGRVHSHRKTRPFKKYKWGPSKTIQQPLWDCVITYNYCPPALSVPSLIFMPSGFKRENLVLLVYACQFQGGNVRRDLWTH